MDRVDRTRLVEPCGSRDDSLCCCFKAQQAVWRDAQLAGSAAPGECGKMQDQDVRRECDGTSRQAMSSSLEDASVL